MVSRLSIDTGVFLGTARNLAIARDGMENAQSIADQARDAIGHQDVLGALGEFASNWESTRGKILKNIEGIGEQAEGIGSTFDQVDSDLADALQKKDSGGSGRGNRKPEAM